MYFCRDPEQEKTIYLSITLSARILCLVFISPSVTHVTRVVQILTVRFLLLHLPRMAYLSRVWCTSWARLTPSSSKNPP